MPLGLARGQHGCRPGESGVEAHQQGGFSGDASPDRPVQSSSMPPASPPPTPTTASCWPVRHHNTSELGRLAVAWNPESSRAGAGGSGRSHRPSSPSSPSSPISSRTSRTCLLSARQRSPPSLIPAAARCSFSATLPRLAPCRRSLGREDREISKLSLPGDQALVEPSAPDPPSHAQDQLCPSEE